LHLETSRKGGEQGKGRKTLVFREGEQRGYWIVETATEC